MLCTSCNVGDIVVRSIQAVESHAEYTLIGQPIDFVSRLHTLAMPIASGDANQACSTFPLAARKKRLSLRPIITVLKALQ